MYPDGLSNTDDWPVLLDGKLALFEKNGHLFLAELQAAVRHFFGEFGLQDTLFQKFNFIEHWVTAPLVDLPVGNILIIIEMSNCGKTAQMRSIWAVFMWVLL